MSLAAHLFLVSQPEVNERADFDELGRWVSEHDPGVSVQIVEDAPAHGLVAPPVPTLTVSPAPVRWFRPPRGPLLQGQHLAKSEEYGALAAAGIRVPRWKLVTATDRPAVDDLGAYVVVKPDRGARGAEVRIVRAGNVHWSPPRTTLARGSGGVLARLLVQEFIYTGPWPVSYRVATLFGHALFCSRTEASRTRKPLAGRGDFRGDASSIVSTGKGCSFTLVDEADIVELAERAHSTFPDLPLLGVDILRDYDSGALYVVEVNSLGYSWHFSSPSGRAIQAQFGLDFDAQWGGRRKAARVLAQVTRERAT